jgi:CMP/dCMP kinase
MCVADLIAIDGPAGSGKSTVGKQLAEYLGYLYFDTGVMYRAVTLAALRRGIKVDNEEAVTRLAEQIQIDVRPPTHEDGRSYDVLVDGEDVTWDIRLPGIDANVSIVSAYPGVRLALSAQQRRVGQRGKVVMVGRDIGTVVLPEAGLKVYLDASVEERARRRFAELLARGEATTLERVLDLMLKRDLIDSTRDVAPLRAAEDAVVLDSDGMTIEQVFDRLKGLVGLACVC